MSWSGEGLVASRLGRRYGDLVALEPLDLTVGPGRALAVIGHNGSGKTTAMRLCAGLLEPTSGRVEVNGVDVHRGMQTAEVRALISFVPDTPVLYDDLTVAEHVELVAVAHGVGGPGLEERIDAQLARLELSPRADFLPRALSRGMRQKTQLACALIRPARLLILDEPIVGLDPPSQRTLADIVRERVADGVSVVVTTHQLAFARAVCDDALVLHDGAMAAAGEVGEVLADPVVTSLGLV